MEKRNEPAFKYFEVMKPGADGEIQIRGGLTKFEYFAGLAFQALMSKEDITATDGWRKGREEKIAEFAIYHASVFVRKLERQ